MPGPAGRHRFGPFEIDLTSGELWRSGVAVKMARQPFQVLALIAAGGGRPVTREELRAAVWADGTVVEFDQGLNYCIRQIRIALGDDARNPVYIETLPKRGYRLIPPLEPVSASEAPRVMEPLRSSRVGIGVGIATVAAIAAALWFVFRPSPVLPNDPAARRMFLEAEHLSSEWELEKINKAIDEYGQVTRIEPRFAPAWAGLANADILLAFLGPQPMQAIRNGEAHARAALDLDRNLPVAHAALGHSYWHQWRWADADAELGRAAKASDDPIAHQLYGLYLAAAGRAAEAVSHGRRAVELAPTSGLINASLAQIYLQTGDFAAAETQARRALEIDRHFPLAFVTILRADALMGNFAGAAEILDEKLRVAPADDASAWQAYLEARTGRTTEARELLRANPSAKGSIGEAIAWYAAGDAEAALAVIERGLHNHAPSLIWLGVAPELQGLHNSSRFVQAMTTIRGS
jgi:DNA-binding winged helix-turn-helix (wHTH) protein/tetratricopeptide (TPR) repeat protein